MKRYYKHIAVIFILLVLFAGLLTNCMLNNIKDTDSILHDDYSYLSLVHGAIAWETGVIRRMYDFGQIFPVYKQDKQARKIIERYEHPDQTDKMVRLIHVFFYRVPGSVGETDFGVTTQFALDDISVVKLVAQIIMQCEQLQQQRVQFEDAVIYVQKLIRKIMQGGWLDKLEVKTTQAGLENKIKDVQKKPWNENAATAFLSMCILFEKNLETELGEKVQELKVHRQSADNFFKLIMEVTKNLKKIFKPVVFKKRENIESFIIQALIESDPQNPNVLYPPRTLEMILLAFIYKKYSYNRTMLKEFYDALNVQFGNKILVRDLDDEWVNDSFAPVTQAQALEQIASIFGLKDLMHSIHEHFAQFVYNAFQIRSFPAPVGYENVVYEYEKGKNTLPFADCMCNAVRNFINMYAYNIEQNKFMVTTLLQTMSISKVNPGLVKFLKDFDNVMLASSLPAHYTWVQMISNLPYVAYNRLIDGITDQSIVALETGKGYIVIPEHEQNIELPKWLKKNGFQIVDKNQYGYELQPSVKNIIIVLDHLLALNLFSKAGLVKEFMRPDFIKHYFPKLCTAIGATGFLSNQKNMEEGEGDKNFDLRDYTARYTYTQIDIAGINSEFSTYSGHGEFELINNGKPTHQEEQILNAFLKNMFMFKIQPSLNLLVSNILCKKEINVDCFSNNLKYVYINFFAIPLENTGLLKKIIDEIFPIITDDIPLIVKIKIKNLLLRLAQNQPDIIEQQGISLEILTLFIKSMSENDWLMNANELIEIIQIAQKSMMDESHFVRQQSLELFKILFEMNQGFNEAIQTAEKGIMHKDDDIKSSALGLFKALFKYDQGFDNAISIAKKSMVDENDKLKRVALLLFIRLVEENKAFDEALHAAMSGIRDKGLAINNAAVKLFKVLIEKDQAFEEVIKITEKAIRKQEPFVRITLALELFSYLILKYPEETKKLIQTLLNDPELQLEDRVKKQFNKWLQD